jgi:hypothetical protein
MADEVKNVKNESTEANASNKEKIVNSQSKSNTSTKQLKDDSNGNGESNYMKFSKTGVEHHGGGIVGLSNKSTIYHIDMQEVKDHLSDAVEQLEKIYMGGRK